MDRQVTANGKTVTKQRAILGGNIMGNKKYVAYVGTYTHGNSKGIQVYDVDVEKGTLRERSEVKVFRFMM